MLPSLLAEDIRTGLKEFLTLGFEPSDAFFQGVVQRFADNEELWWKGPWVQVGLPFRPGEQGKDYFAQFSLPFGGYEHQEQAWGRICSDQGAANTLVATGTGSGKTECFLYPVLDHCAGCQERGEAGIKALMIYPMNALATDQARRFAELCHQIPRFKQLRVGLFVGGLEANTGKVVMTPKEVITDRETLRKNPPDILLTNYKMLDYLLIRPKDQQLWRENQPQTLRYIVVDELHTFDGAQGTDLAMLLRRLRARLKTTPEQMIHVGTSATLGDASATAPLREYAEQVFGGAFPEECVITEKRLSMAEFLEEIPEYVLQDSDGLEERLNPLNYSSPEAAIQPWFGLFFPDVAEPPDVSDPQWRIELGGLLKRHLLFQNLLRRLGRLPNHTATVSSLAEALTNQLPLAFRPHARELLNALLALVAWARTGTVASTRSLVTVRVIVWSRELRRMVARVTPRAEEVNLLPEMALPLHSGIYLPLIQCSECHTTGWLTRMGKTQTVVTRDLDQIYQGWFSRSPESLRLYPKEGVRETLGQASEAKLCTICGAMNPNDNREECLDCHSGELLPVWSIAEIKPVQRGGVPYHQHLQRCPSCGARDRLILLGARTTTLGAQIVEQSWQTPFNDDKKLIAFSDSVQDAAHRAGFFRARTYSANVRKAVFRQARHHDAPFDLLQLLTALQSAHSAEGSPLQMQPENFVAEFIGPNMEWQKEWLGLLEHGALEQPSPLLERVGQRLAWQAFGELTFLSRRGRSLERQGLLLAAPNPELVAQVAQRMIEPLRETLGLEMEASAVFQWLWGFLDYLRQRGAVLHPEMQGYAHSGSLFSLMSRPRNLWLPNMGTHSFHPVMLSLGRHRYQDALQSPQGVSWYQRWMERHLTLADADQIKRAYLLAIEQLENVRILTRITSEREGAMILIRPESLLVWNEPVQLVSDQGQYWLNVPKQVQERLLGMPCLDGDASYQRVRSRSEAQEQRLLRSDLGRIYAAEHTGLLERKPREDLENRFKEKNRQAWYENLLSATPTLEMGVDIGDLSSVMLCSTPPGQANFLQRIGRAGRRDGNAFAITIADGSSPHDLYFYEDPLEMLTGPVQPPGVFLAAAEVLRRQLFAFCLDNWVQSGLPRDAFPDRTKEALEALQKDNQSRFPIHFEKFVRNTPSLLEDFLTLLRPNLTELVEQRLREYFSPQGESEGMLGRLSLVLQDLIQDRAQYQKKVKELKNRLDQLRQKPEDESTLQQMEELKRERSSIQGMITELDHRQLLNTLTDAGLIPNYAFPESGVELKSVIWRRRQDQEGEIEAPTYKYERPAATALAEFAPRNRFYANHRRVEVDQVEIQQDSIETWRFCPECPHSQRIDLLHKDDQQQCPRCHAELWKDHSQKMKVLRLRRVIATTEDSKSRIDDSQEDREPKFYVRQTLVDFPKEQIRRAWKLDREDLPFGFEYVEQADFRDVNFGERLQGQQAIPVAGQNDIRPGFSLCTSCGKVRSSQDDEENASARNHAIDCVYYSNPAPEAWVQLHLYREYQSELLRILVPYTSAEVDESAVQSFIAALQLGFKLQFGGRVDHLRFTEQDLPNPVDPQGSRRRYILIYDSVPGGTGYLNQLLAQQAHTMMDLLRKAQEHLLQCGCQDDPDRDGCYRCVYQYRMSRKMPEVSRSRALELLKELLKEQHPLVQVDTLAEVQMHPLFDSPLEQNFLEAIQRLSGKDGFPQIRLVKDIVKGKVGYRLHLGEQRYLIELQKNLGENEGVRVASRPDFLITCLSSPKMLPIAVFCDGWKYHQHIMSEDALKRSAIVASANYRVWSITHQDVEGVMQGKLKATELSSPLTSPTVSHRREKPSPNTNIDGPFWQDNALTGLVRWLWRGGDDFKKSLPQWQRNAFHTLAQIVCLPDNPSAASARQTLTRFWETQHPGDEPPSNCVPTMSREGAEPVIFAWWLQQYRNGESPWSDCGVVSIDPHGPPETLHQCWRVWLWLFNHLQFLPGLLMTTKDGLESGAYSVLAEVQPDQRHVNGTSAEWGEVIQDAAEELRNGLLHLAEEGVRAPDGIGEEFEDERGRVYAEAELCWQQHQLCVLTLDQGEYQKPLQDCGWSPILAEVGWENQIVELLKRGCP
jgi:DEAD/DEAH box helicase domain-containing protein